MGKKFRSVLEMIEDISDDEDFINRFKEECDSKFLSRILFTVRNLQRLTPEELAQKMNVDLDYISSLEHTPNNEMKIIEFGDYVSAAGCNLFIEVGPQRNLAGWVKYHATEMEEYLNRLAGLAQGDKEIQEGIAKFVGDTKIALLGMLESTLSKLGPLEPVEADRRLISTDFEDPIGGHEAGEALEKAES